MSETANGSDQKTIATSVIAAAEEAVATLNSSQESRTDGLKTLNELFVVVEQRYQAMREDLEDRDARLQALEETNQLLINALGSLTQRIHESARTLDDSDTDLSQAVARSEALVSATFGTGGNANPTRPPDAGPVEDPSEETPDVSLEDLEWDSEDLETEASGPAPSEDGDDGGETDQTEDDLVFEEAPEPDDGDSLFDDQSVALDPGPDGEGGAAEEDAGDLMLEPIDSVEQVSGADAVTEAGPTDGDTTAESDDISPHADESAPDGEDPFDDLIEEIAEVPDQTNSDEDGESDRGIDADDATEDETAPLSWTETWSVGAPDMDGDHRVLIGLINTLPQAFTATENDWVVGSVLNSLWDYAGYHFDREEALLRAANFPGAEDHAGRHQVLRAQVRDWLERYQANPDAIDPKALLVFLKGWLMNHVLGEDMRYKPYVENNPDAQSVAAAIPPDPTLMASVNEMTGATQGAAQDAQTPTPDDHG